MDTRLILDDPDRIGAFVAERIGRVRPWWGHSAIGLEVNGELVAGAVFENYFPGKSLEGHVAALPGCRWAHPVFVQACFEYAFVQLGVKHLYGHVSTHNLASQRMVEHLGFKRKCVLEGAIEDGDLIIYVMQPEDCRYLEADHVSSQS